MSTITVTPAPATRTAHFTTVTYGAGKAVHLGDPATPGAPLCERTKGGVATPVEAAVTCGHCVRRWAKGDVEVRTQLPSDYFPAVEVPDSPAELVATPGFADPANIPADERYAQGDRRNMIAYDRHERKAQKAAREMAQFGWASRIEHLDNVDGTAETLLHVWRGEGMTAEYIRIGYADGQFNYDESIYTGRGRTFKPRNVSAARQIAKMDPMAVSNDETPAE